MNEFEKNQILTKVSYVLQFCQEIVSRLSSTSPAEEVNNNHNLDKDTHKELIETIAKFSDEEQRMFTKMMMVFGGIQPILHLTSTLLCLMTIKCLCTV